MKNSLVLSILLCSYCPLLLAQSAADRPINNDKSFSQIQLDIISRHCKSFPENSQVAVAVIDNEEALYFGYVRKNDTLVYIDNRNSVFEIGSITKVFTSLLMSYAIEGLHVKLDQPIQEILDFQLNTSTPITFWHLSNHSSGLPPLPPNIYGYMAKEPDNPYKYYSEQALENYLRSEITTVAELGSKSVYSNLGAGLLGYLLTKVYNTSFEELLQDKIFNPLDMKWSTTVRERVTPRLVPGLNKEGLPTANWDLNVLAGAGAIYSSVADMVKFARFSFQATPVNQRIQTKTLTLNSEMGIALGWHTYHAGDSIWLWHNGGTGGYRACMAIDPSQRFGVVVLSNVSAFHKETAKIDAICFDLVKWLEE